MSIKYTIDGVEVIAEASDTILSSALRAGVEIPTLCFDKRTAIYGACGICLVEVEGVPKLLRACSAKPMETRIPTVSSVPGRRLSSCSSPTTPATAAVPVS